MGEDGNGGVDLSGEDGCVRLEHREDDGEAVYAEIDGGWRGCIGCQWCSELPAR